MTPEQLKLVLETALLCADEPMTINDLRRLFLEELSVEELNEALAQIQADWEAFRAGDWLAFSKSFIDA
jgi:segregation and condensation protein B